MLGITENEFFYLANDLAKEQKLNFGDDIACQLRAARKKRWGVQEEKRIAQEIELQTYINRLIREDTENQIAKLRLECTNEEELQQKIQECERRCVSISDILSKDDL